MMSLHGAVASTALVSFLGVAALGCASGPSPAEPPTSAASEENRASKEPALQDDLETSMEFEGAEEDNAASREEYIPPPTQAYSPATKLKEKTPDRVGK